MANPIRDAYNRYVADGGELDYLKWLHSGMPKAPGHYPPHGTTQTDPLWWLKKNVFPWEKPPTTGSARGVEPGGKWVPFSRYGTGDKEFDAYYDWAKTLYGGLKISGLTPDNYKADNSYTWWVQNGKPVAPSSVPSPASEKGIPLSTPSTTPTTPENLTFTGMYPDKNGNPRVLQRSDGKYFYPDGVTEMSMQDVFNFNSIAQSEANTRNNPPAPSDPNAITQYQQGNLDLQRQQFEWQQRQAQIEADRQQAEAKNKEWVAQYNLQTEASQSAIQKQQNEMELIKGRAFPFGDEDTRRRMMAENSAGAFESARQSILGSLSSPSDWIKRWEVQNAPNPYTPKPQSQLEQKQSELSNTETRANMFDQMANEAEKLVTQLSSNQDYGAGTPNEATVLTQARNDITNYRNAAQAERARAGIFQTDVTYLQGQPQPEMSAPGRPGNAPTPGWLPMFAPGQRAGQPITRENVATPSAQQWSSTPWSVQQGLSGYLDWAGYRPMADVLGNMAQMLPNSPGGGSRWSPYIGR